MANAAITVDLNAKIAQFETELKKATGSLDRFEKKSQQAAAAIKNTFGTLGLTIGAGVMVRGIARMADEFSGLQARLKLASRDTAEFNAANADLIRISQSAQAPLSETATLYTRIAASVKDLDVSQRAVADTTEAVALALKISGASGVEASSAMLQFSQAMASGVLRGDEFNSINEAAPRLLQALAASLKVPVGSLREMAKEGQLTRDVLINGLLAELPKLQAEASTLPKTIGAAFTDLNNKLLLTVGELNKVTGASLAVGEAISSIGTTGIEALSVLGANVAFVFKGIGNEIGGIGAQLSRLAVGDFEGFSAIGRMMKADAAQARKELDEFEKKILGVGKTASRAASSGVAVASPTLGTKEGKKKTGGAKSDPQGAFVAKLRDEAATLGMTGEALQRYEALKLRLTGSNKKLADSYITQIAAFKEQQEAAKANNEAFDEAIKKQDQLDAALENSIKSVREWIAEQEFEVSLIGLSNSERETAIQMRALETAGIDTQTESYKKLTEQVAAANSKKRGISILSGTETAKTKEFMADIAALDDLFFSGEAGAKAYAEGIDLITGSTEKAQKEMDTFAETAAKNIQNSMADFLFDPFDKGMKGMLQGFGQMLQKMIAEAVAADLAKKLFGGLTDGGKTGGSGLVGAGLDWLGGLFGTGSANGNAFSASGVKLSGFATGGIASGPASGYPVLMHGTEAILPLKRGSNGKLGVEGGGGGHTIIVNVSGSNNAPDVRRAAGQGAREALGMINGAKRYA
jgi:tape measure domain-containing protein